MTLMFYHNYPFDPGYGHDLTALLGVAAPEEPGDFAAFWRDLYARARSADVAMLCISPFLFTSTTASDAALPKAKSRIARAVATLPTRGANPASIMKTEAAA